MACAADLSLATSASVRLMEGDQPTINPSSVANRKAAPAVASAPAAFLPPEPLRSLISRHTVGLTDPLTDATIPAGERVDDGLPQSLEACVRTYGLTHFKIKLWGDAARDHDRLRGVADVIERHLGPEAPYAFTLDGNENFKAIEPFPTRDAERYDTAFLSGHVVEHYQVVLVEAAQRSLDQMRAALTEMCARQIPGDTYRNLQIQPSFEGRTFKHVLVPVWVLAYTYSAKPYQVVVNGVTGAIAGRYPYSVWKIVALVAFVLVIAAGLLATQDWR